MYDGIRHFLVILPPLSIFAGFAVWQTCVYIYHWTKKSSRIIYFFYLLFIAVGYISILITDIRLHPYQIVFFNRLTGGIKGAYSKFDLDYWGQSFKEAAEWINLNLPTGAKIHMSNPMIHHFPIDQKRFTFVAEDGDYEINLIRGMLKTWDADGEGYLYPSIKPIYSVKVEGIDILRIFKSD